MTTVVNENPDQNPTGSSFWDKTAQLPGKIGSRLPTFDKSLDTYFDQNFSAIIEEWDLVTESDLQKLENRLSRVTDDITSLFAEKMTLDARVKDLDAMISSLER
jgi:hypothetical protein